MLMLPDQLLPRPDDVQAGGLRDIRVITKYGIHVGVAFRVGIGCQGRTVAGRWTLLPAAGLGSLVISL